MTSAAIQDANLACTARYLHREGHDFLLLCGDLSLNTLKEFLHEVYHEVRAREATSRDVGMLTTVLLRPPGPRQSAPRVKGNTTARIRAHKHATPTVAAPQVVVLVGDAFKMEHRDWVTKHVLYKTRVTYLKVRHFD